MTFPNILKEDGEARMIAVLLEMSLWSFSIVMDFFQKKHYELFIIPFLIGLAQKGANHFGEQICDWMLFAWSRLNTHIL